VKKLFLFSTLQSAHKGMLLAIHAPKAAEPQSSRWHAFKHQQSTNHRHGNDDDYGGMVTTQTARMADGLRVLLLLSALLLHNQASAWPLTNQTVQCQSLSKNQNQDHTHKQLGLLCVGPAVTAATQASGVNIP
jgi:hypothetical protein